MEVRELMFSQSGIDKAVCESDAFGTDMTPRSLDKQDDREVKVAAEVAAIIQNPQGLVAEDVLADLGVEEGDSSGDDEEEACAEKDYTSRTPNTVRAWRNILRGLNLKDQGDDAKVSRLASLVYAFIKANIDETDDPTDYDVRKLFRARRSSSARSCTTPRCSRIPTISPASRSTSRPSRAVSHGSPQR